MFSPFPVEGEEKPAPEPKSEAPPETGASDESLEDLKVQVDQLKRQLDSLSRSKD